MREDQNAAPSRGWKSDRFIVPMRPPKEPPGTAGTRRAEGRDRLGDILDKMAKVRAQNREALPPNLVRVNEAARRDRGTRFVALLHHVNVEALERAYRRMAVRASAGVDGETVESYGQSLEGNLRDLCTRVHTGRYQPQPVRRVYIPKSDGGRRPLGVPALEDKLVQSAVSEVLNAIYEEDFLALSYGFRPGKGCHMALSALRVARMQEKVNWVLDADVRRFSTRLITSG
jgi:RNA-directed DNA polymerase